DGGRLETGRRRPRLRLGQCALGSARPGASRCQRHADRGPGHRHGRRRARRARGRRVRELCRGTAGGQRARGDRPPAGRRASGARNLRRHAGPVRTWRGARAGHPRARRVARCRRAAAGPGGAAHGLEQRRGTCRVDAVPRRRGRPVLLRALLRRAGLHAADQGTHPGTPGDLGRARRRPFRGRGGERAAVCHPVPSREVRRRRGRPAAQLGGIAV
ncbi:MAG: Imidazole glycerol phosphate synthase amidotransferase subunit, partial [uncultured Nocardioidaceae bacterium]